MDTKSDPEALFAKVIETAQSGDRNNLELFYPIGMSDPLEWASLDPGAISPAASGCLRGPGRAVSVVELDATRLSRPRGCWDDHHVLPLCESSSRAIDFELRDRMVEPCPRARFFDVVTFRTAIRIRHAMTFGAFCIDIFPAMCEGVTTIAIQPPAPPCPSGGDHRWQIVPDSDSAGDTHHDQQCTRCALRCRVQYDYAGKGVTAVGYWPGHSPGHSPDYLLSSNKPTGDAPPVDLRGRVAEGIARERVEAGLTQAQLAVVVGCSASRISHYESGERSPSFERLEEIADAIGVDVVAIIDSQPS